MWKLHVEFSVSEDMKFFNNDKRRIPAYPLLYLSTLIVKKLKISVEHSRVLTNNIKYNVTLNILFSMVFMVANVLKIFQITIGLKFEFV